ncbi:MAG: carbohydrate kinase family protein [Pirellulaceae bacterium]
MGKDFDCVVCGCCTVDILVKPIELHQPLRADQLIEVSPIETTTGGIVSNSATALARLGMRTAASTLVGEDDWSAIIRRKLSQEGIDLSHLISRPELPTSTTAVMIDEMGQRSFAHCPGAPQKIDRKFFLDQMDFFASCRALLLGYYSLLPNVEPDLPEVMQKIRSVGCLTALDSVGNGGDANVLRRILPHLDLYVPSFGEAANQTGLDDPHAILKRFREWGAMGLLGVKLGSRGAILSPKVGEIIRIEAISPPGPVIDTTGAGDSFYAGLITGLLNGMSVVDAGRLAAATGAACVTALGASAGLRNLKETKQLAGL